MYPRKGPVTYSFSIHASKALSDVTVSDRITKLQNDRHDRKNMPPSQSSILGAENGVFFQHVIFDINMSYGATVGASAANSDLIEFKK